MKLRILLTIILMFCALPAFSVEPDEILSDPVLEERARSISTNLRCLVCQNQSIDDSNADLARDLRLLVRERLVAGDTDDQVIDYLVDRYGEFVLLKPYFGWHTIALWLTAPTIILFAVFMLVLRARKKNPAASPVLDAAAVKVLDSLGNDDPE